MGAVLRTSGSFAIRPSTIRAAWALGWPIGVWSWSLVNPWLTGPSGPQAVETWLFEVLPASAFVLGSLSVLTIPFASQLRSWLPDAPTRADRAALIAALLLTTAMTVLAMVTPSATTVREWEQRLGSPLAGPVTINHAERLTPPDGVRSAFAINLRAPDVPASVEPRPRVPVDGRVLIVSACSRHTRYVGFDGTRESTEVFYPPEGPWQPIRLFEMGHGTWLVSSSLRADGNAAPVGMIRVLAGQSRFWEGMADALGVLPRPLGAPPAFAWMAALAPILAGMLALGARRARARLAWLERAIETTPVVDSDGLTATLLTSRGAQLALDAPTAFPRGTHFVLLESTSSRDGYRLDARPTTDRVVPSRTDREARMAEARSTVARLEALAVLVMIVLATPGLVALLRGFTLSLGLS